VIQFKIFLSEGMIKLPVKMFKEGERLIVSDICSYVITDLEKYKREPDVHLFSEHVKKVASQHAAPLRSLKKKTRSKFKIKLSLEGLPEKYREGFGSDKNLDLDLDWVRKGRLTDLGAGGSYKDTEAGKIVIGIFPIIELELEKKVALNKKREEEGKKNAHLYSEMVDLFDRRLDRILLSFEHELTHYVQYKALSKLSDKQTGHSEHPGKRDAYFNSQIEFDPLIRSALGEFHTMEKDNDEAGMKGSRRDWIAIFVGSKSIPSQKFAMARSEKYGGFIEPSDFFLSLKKHSPDKWRKAVKLFTQEIEKRYPR
jgi:hypothetical protein